MRRRQLLRVAGTATGLSLASTTALAQEEEATDDCTLPECIHPVLGYTAFSRDDVEDLPNDLQPDHEVTLRVEEQDDAGDDETEESHAFFDPTGIAVEAGDVVEFHFDSHPHTITAFHPDLGRQRRVPEGTDPFSSPVLTAGDVWLYRFDESGVYDLYCSTHELVGMVARIVVDATEHDVGDVDEPALNGPTPTAAAILDDEALDPANVEEAGTVGWDEIDDENKEVVLFETPEEPDEDPDEEEDDPDEEAEEDPEGDADEVTIEVEGVELVEYELVEDGLFTAIEGELVNESGDELDSIYVEATFYDEDGTRIDDSSTIVTDVEAGEQVAFDVTTTADPDEIDEYTITVTDSGLFG